MLERRFAESVEEILAASFSESKNTKVNVYVHTWSAVAEILMIKISLAPPLLNISISIPHMYSAMIFIYLPP